jgi:hypothetical protein
MHGDCGSLLTFDINFFGSSLSAVQSKLSLSRQIVHLEAGRPVQVFRGQFLSGTGFFFLEELEKLKNSYYIRWSRVTKSERCPAVVARLWYVVPRLSKKVLSKERFRWILCLAEKVVVEIITVTRSGLLSCKSRVLSSATATTHFISDIQLLVTAHQARLRRAVPL